MDKLTLQTVYVPVLVTDRDPEYEFKRIACIEAEGSIYELTAKELQVDIAFEHSITHWLDKQDNRIVLTPQELQFLLDEYIYCKQGCAVDFLKSKGIEI